MKDVNLKPGWLRRDIARAVARVLEWEGKCARCGGSKIVGGMRYYATGTLTDAKSCPDCRAHS